MREGEPKQISLENLFEKLSRGELLEMTDEERECLYAGMSQEDIVRYYQTVSSLEDENRERVLAKWIPKPKILYHVSHSDNIDVFEPREKSKRHESDPPLVFSSPVKAVSSLFLLEHSNNDISGSYNGGKTWALVAESLDDLKKRNRPGFMYSLPPDDFKVDPHIGLGLYEWSSESAVAPNGKEKINSALETILELGVQIYLPSNELSMDEFRNGDQAALLEKMRRVTLEDI